MDTLKWSAEQRRDELGHGPRSKTKGVCPVCRKPLDQKDEPGPRRSLIPLEIQLTTRSKATGKRKRSAESAAEQDDERKLVRDVKGKGVARDAVGLDGAGDDNDGPVEVNDDARGYDQGLVHNPVFQPGRQSQPQPELEQEQLQPAQPLQHESFWGTFPDSDSIFGLGLGYEDERSWEELGHIVDIS